LLIICRAKHKVYIQEAKLSLGEPTVLSKIVGVTWPRLRPLSGKFICEPARHCPYKAVYQIWSL